MTDKLDLMPGVTLRTYPDRRFKQGCLTFQIVRPMCEEEAAMNALLPAVLLRGTEKHRDLRDITLRLDELYGASVGALVRRVGDYQTTGLSCGFIEDRFCIPGDQVLAPMIDFIRELLVQPSLEDGGFCKAFVESEKKNLIATIESELNDKRVYAMGRMVKTMCKADSYGVPRLGDVESAAAIDPVTLYQHYQKILKESRIDIFYVGSADLKEIAAMVKPLLDSIQRDYKPLPGQTPFQDVGGEDVVEEMDVTQGKLCMGFTTPVTNRDPDFVPMQVMNTIFGAGMTSKLFVNVREKLSLCYSVGSGYYGSKGIITVSAGIDFDKELETREEILRQLKAMQDGDISQQELLAAKEALLSSLRGTHDSPGSIEGFYATSALSGLALTPAEYMEAIYAVTVDQVVQAAQAVKLHTTYFLKGENA